MEPLKQSPIAPKIPSAPPQKKRGHLLKRLYDLCIGIIKNLGEIFLKVSVCALEILKKPFSKPELLPISFVEKLEDLPTIETLRAAHFQFHRLELDPESDFPGFGILNGAYTSDSFDHFLNTNWHPGRSILVDSSPSPELKAKLDDIDTILHESSNFFLFDDYISDSRLAQRAVSKIENFYEKQCLLLPGGPDDHMILYEIKKEKEKWYLKVYNPGAGTERTDKESERFIVPCYEIENKDSIHQILAELYGLRSLTLDQLKKKEGKLSLAIEKIVTHHGGKRLPSEETHRMQDRGNCTWKAISTWFREQTSSIEITITQEMVDNAGKNAPYAQKTLAQLVGKQITLNRFFKIVGYEKVRAALIEIFVTHVGAPPSPEIEEGRKYRIFKKPSLSRFEESENEKKAKEYLSALARRIIKESAIERYERKDRMRKRIKT